VAIADIPLSESGEILRRLNRLLDEQFHISHTTIQFESLLCDTNHACFAPANEAVPEPRRGI
jgi:cobalt-zinc-cadmium efflux system protein